MRLEIDECTRYHSRSLNFDSDCAICGVLLGLRFSVSSPTTDELCAAAPAQDPWTNTEEGQTAPAVPMTGWRYGYSKMLARKAKYTSQGFAVVVAGLDKKLIEYTRISVISNYSSLGGLMK